MIALSYVERKLREISRKLARLAEINRELRAFPADVGGYDIAPKHFRAWISENEVEVQNLKAERSDWEVKKQDLLRSLELNGA